MGLDIQCTPRLTGRSCRRGSLSYGRGGCSAGSGAGKLHRAASRGHGAVSSGGDGRGVRVLSRGRTRKGKGHGNECVLHRVDGLVGCLKE